MKFFRALGLLEALSFLVLLLIAMPLKYMLRARDLAHELATPSGSQC